MSQSALDQIIRDTPGLWRGKEGRKQFGSDRLGGANCADKNVVDTGFPELNALLPTGGWPLRSIVEIQVPCWGNGELQPLLPFIAKLTTHQSRVAMVAPPYTPYAPALTQHGVQLSQFIVVDIASERSNQNIRRHRLIRRKGHQQASSSRAKEIWWAAEKLLRHEDCGLVLAWPLRPDAAQVRRLQLAADASNSIGVIFQSGKTEDTPVGLRLRVERCVDGVTVRLLKSRYGWRQYGEVVLPNFSLNRESIPMIEPKLNG